jgi:hypothetical protein
LPNPDCFEALSTNPNDQAHIEKHPTIILFLAELIQKCKFKRTLTMKIINTIVSLTTACLLIACSDETKTPVTAAGKVEVSILNWGPQGTKAGTGFAVQANGNSALWFEQRGIHSADSVQVWFDNTQLAGMALTPNVGGSAEVPPALIAKPGKYPVYLILKPQNQRVELGTFEVLP